MYYICPVCGRVYYSAADLKHLVNPYCDCGTRLEAAGREALKCNLIGEECGNGEDTALPRPRRQGGNP